MFQEVHEVDSCEDITNPTQWERPVSSSQNLSQRAQSTSCLDLHTSSDIDNLRSLLPSYRPAPDYETAVQQKYRNSSSALLPSEQLRNTHAIVYSSQPEIHQSDGYATHLRYPDITHNTFEQKNPLYNNPAFIESPYLLNENRQVNFDNVGIVHLYKQPPPYPANKIGSNSTPDLAGISQQAKLPNLFVNNLISGSSPDLVSGDHRYLKQYNEVYQNPNAHPIHRSQSYLPQQQCTYENVSSIFNNNMLGRPQQAVIVENPNITKHIKKVYDEHGNIIYCMPANMKQILQNNKLPNRGFVVTRNQNAVVAHDTELTSSSEPIYENIPRPWQNENEMRSRTQSIHSAPEISQVVNHSLVSALQAQFQKTNFGTGDNSRENMYANIRMNSSKTNLNETFNVQDMTNESNNVLNPPIHSTESFVSPPHINSNKESLRTSNLTVNSDSSNMAISSSSISNTSENISHADGTTTSKTKKKRWGLLMGKSKSDEKVKSATLRIDKKKEDKGHGKYRWSTGQSKFNPLPPSITKEAMVSLKIGYLKNFMDIIGFFVIFLVR